MTQFVFLAMMKNLLNGTKSVAAPTSLPTNVGAINCYQEGWGLCLSCTPAGVNPKIRKGTTITITRLPEPPDISLSRCFFSFLCANPRPGTSAQTVAGVEDENSCESADCGRRWAKSRNLQRHRLQRLSPPPPLPVPSHSRYLLVLRFVGIVPNTRQSMTLSMAPCMNSLTHLLSTCQSMRAWLFCFGWQI